MTPGTRYLLAAAGGVALGLLAEHLAGTARAGVLVAPFAVAAVVDARTRRIPNAVSLAAAVLALTLTAASGGAPTTVASAIAGAVAAAAVGLGLRGAARGAFGMGDVKLLSAAAACVGIGALPALLAATALAGGAIGLAFLVAQRHRAATMPYGPAIAAGLGWLLLVRG